LRIIGSIVSWIVLILLVAAVAIVAVPQFMGARLYTILTKSMSPTYNIGDLVYVFPADFDKIEVDDTITFFINTQGTVNTHRVVEKNGEEQSFITRGDNEERNDTRPAYYSNVVGKVGLHIPKVGSMIKPISTPGGKIAVSCGIGVCVIIMNLISFLMMKKPENENENEKED